MRWVLLVMLVGCGGAEMTPKTVRVDGLHLPDDAAISCEGGSTRLGCPPAVCIVLASGKIDRCLGAGGWPCQRIDATHFQVTFLPADSSFTVEAPSSCTAFDGETVCDRPDSGHQPPDVTRYEMRFQCQDWPPDPSS